MLVRENTKCELGRIQHLIDFINYIYVFILLLYIANVLTEFCNESKLLHSKYVLCFMLFS